MTEPDRFPRATLRPVASLRALGARGTLLPGATIGILGGGQLGRMLGSAARAMGYRIVVLDPDPACPAAAIADRVRVLPSNVIAVNATMVHHRSTAIAT